MPTLPGFGFSAKPAGTGWDPGRIAGAWITLMGRLGYERWGAQGGDLGCAVTDEMARRAPAGLIGMHLNFAMFGSKMADIGEAVLSSALFTIGVGLLVFVTGAALRSDLRATAVLFRTISLVADRFVTALHRRDTEFVAALRRREVEERRPERVASTYRTLRAVGVVLSVLGAFLVFAGVGQLQQKYHFAGGSAVLHVAVGRDDVVQG
jgi:pimeloyl-ACP methyl ester carboxylesterase